MQHSILQIVEEAVVNEIPNEDLLHRGAKSADVGLLASCLSALFVNDNRLVKYGRLM
jgi:hypothetical protein